MIETEHLMYGLAAIGGVGLLLVFIILIRRRSRQETHHKRERELRASVSQKAAMSELAISDAEASAREDSSLSDSGAFAIDELVDTLIRAGDLDAAETWASNALRTDPDHISVAVKLAQIYHKRQKRNEFFSILSKHVITRKNDIDAGEWRRIEGMVSDFSTPESGSTAKP